MEKIARTALEDLDWRIATCIKAREQAKARGDARAMLYWNMQSATAAYKHYKINTRFLKGI